MASIIDRTSLARIPTCLAKVLELGDSDADVRELVAIVESDPALTARILRTANSPFFGQTRGVTTVSRATVLLGTTMVRNLTIGLSVWDSVETKIPAAMITPLWEHALAVARVAHELASRSGTCEGADAFTAGLLHDVGQLVLARRFGEDYLPLLACRAPARPIEVLEREAFAVDHAEVGASLFDTWRLPHAIVEAVARHHDRPRAPGLPAVVAIACTLASPGDAATTSPHAAGESALAAAAEAGLAPELLLAIVERPA